MPNLAIFASGSGTNAENLIRSFQNDPQLHVRAVFSNKPDAFVLERARNFQVPAEVFTKAEFNDPAFLDRLEHYDIDYIILAGFLLLVPAYLIKAFPERIVNIHPALLPKFGGKGMYGQKVHEAVLAAGETKTGITIHLVNEEYDKGKILFQADCPVSSEDTTERVAAKVQALEYRHFPGVVREWIGG
jgi:phosphoribosylglycinamide formyltransferase 1